MLVFIFRSPDKSRFELIFRHHRTIQFTVHDTLQTLQTVQL